MRRYIIPALIALVWSAVAAYAAAPGVINSYVGVCDPNFAKNCAAPNSSGQLPITGTITTTQTNFTPTGAATLAVSNSSSNVALPTADPTLIIQNVGTTTFFFNLGVGNTTTAATTNNSLPPGAMIAVNVGANTYLAAITSSGTSTANLIQGTGAPEITGGPPIPTGAAGTANANVVSVQGIASATPVIATGSGTAGSAAAGVLTVQGIASMTKILVTPDALPANQSVNVAQFGGNAVATGTGAGGTGIPRVTVSNDSSLAANQSVNINQIAGASTDPCFGSVKSSADFESASSGGSIITAVSAKKAYICSATIVTSTAANVSLIEGTGSSVCTGGTTAGVLLNTGVTAANGAAFAANGGVNLGGANATIGVNATANQNICVLFTTTNSPQVNVHVTYIQQ